MFPTLQICSLRIKGLPIVRMGDKNVIFVHLEISVSLHVKSPCSALELSQCSTLNVMITSFIQEASSFCFSSPLNLFIWEQYTYNAHNYTPPLSSVYLKSRAGTKRPSHLWDSDMSLSAISEILYVFDANNSPLILSSRVFCCTLHCNMTCLSHCWLCSAYSGV